MAANGFTKSQITFFEKVIEGFNATNVAARNCEVFEAPASEVEHSGLTIRRPVPMIAEITTGRDVSADYKDLKELTVPMDIAETDILNHAFKLNALELADPSRRDKAAKAASQALSTKVDTLVSDEVRASGSLIACETGAMTSYEHLSRGEVALFEREVDVAADRYLGLTPSMAQKMANDLGQRATDNERDRSAYERSRLPMVGGFETLRSNVITSLTGSASAGVTVNGANQRKTPTVFDGTNSAAADNRSQTLAVSAGHGMVAGDRFTIAGVNAIGMISKKDTGRLQTFVVLSVNVNDLTISPAIIPVDQAATEFKKYGNCTTTPANGAAITLLNTDTVSPSIFWVKRAVNLFHGKLAVADLSPTVAVMRAKTDSGIEIVFARQGNIDDLVAKYRLSCWVNAHVLEPQMAGVYLPNQNAAFGG